MRTRLLDAVIMVVCFLTAVGTSGCGAGSVRPDGGVLHGNPQVELGLGDLQFLQASQDTRARVVVDKVVPTPFESWSWRQAGLESKLDDVPAHPLGDPTNPITVSYQSSIANLFHQQEILLFARDPEEEYQTLAAIPVAMVPFFRQQVAPNLLPLAFTRVYPPIPGWTPGKPMPFLGGTEIMKPQQFWSGASPQPQSAAAEPDGHGSIKFAEVVQHGFCSTEIKLSETQPGKQDGLLDAISDGLFNQFKASVYANEPSVSCADPLRGGSIATVFLRQSTEESEEQFGGFLLNFGFGIHYTLGGITDNNILYKMAYRWRLKGTPPLETFASLPTGILDSIGPLGSGRLGVEATRLQTAVGGHNAGDVDLQFRTALEETLPSQIYQKADRMLVFRGQHPEQLNEFACTPKSPFAGLPPGVLVVGDTSSGQCDEHPATGFIGFTTLAASVGGGRVHPQLDPIETEEVVATMKSFHTFGNLKIYDNFRCNAYTDDSNQSVSRCEYVVPTKRINVFPDSVELVFLDGDREISNPAYGVYLITLNQVDAPNPLCTRVPGAVNGRFATVFRDFLDPGCP